jgi:transposase
MRPFFMSYVRGEDRGQAALLPATIEDYVTADASVRVVDAFVDGLDVKGLGFGRSVPATTGRPPYDPRDLLKLYLYGYLNEVRSSRRLERECYRNVEVMWLLHRLAPDFKTIADFRRDNGAAIVGACRAFVLFCRDQGLFTARLVALDGSKFRAATSAKRVMGRREIVEKAARIDRRIAEYLADLDESDARELDEVPSATAAALAALKAQRIELDRLATQLEAEDRNTLVEGEPDARPMGIGRGSKPPSYNVQTAVDVDTALIIHHDVTGEPNDTRQLYSMAKATKDTLGLERLTVVADAGYSNGTAAAACEADGIIACAPTNRSVNNQGDGMMFDRSAFVYQTDVDTYTCPAGHALTRKRVMRRDSLILYVASDCMGCVLKPRCTTAERRFITRHLHEDALERMNARFRADPNLIRYRRCASEHPFGTIKRMTAGGRFLTRGFKKVGAEAALSVLAYNIIRAINLVGVVTLRAKLA